MKTFLSVPLFLTFLAFPVSAEQKDTQHEKNIWFEDAQKTLQQRLHLQPQTQNAKNIILFIADGNGVTSNTAIRIFEGQKQGKPGEENYLAYEKFPYTALIKTYNTNAQVPDSAGTATAINTGVKTRLGVLGLSDKALRGVCENIDKNRVMTLAEHAERAGMATGIVTTTRVTHATPAAVYAHSPDRSWEHDGKTKGDCKDIALQLIDFPYGDGLDVVLGGGRRNFLPKTARGSENAQLSGSRRDGRDLTQEWLAENKNRSYVWDKESLNKLDIKKNPKVLGLFAPSHMAYEADRLAEGPDQPSLAEMTAKALELLRSHDKGFFLMVEGGRVDHAHHAGNAYRALYDGVAFHEAVKTALDMTNPEETLIIVTADHSHTFLMNGYPQRGNPILGLVKDVNKQGLPQGMPALAADGKPYTTLGYGNGPGSILLGKAREERQEGETTSQGRPDLTDIDTQAPDFRQQSLLPSPSETHSGEDVALYAKGPGAYMFGGVLEQNYIFHAMRHALDLDRRDIKKKQATGE